MTKRQALFIVIAVVAVALVLLPLGIIFGVEGAAGFDAISGFAEIFVGVGAMLFGVYEFLTHRSTFDAVTILAVGCGLIVLGLTHHDVLAQPLPLWAGTLGWAAIAAAVVARLVRPGRSGGTTLER